MKINMILRDHLKQIGKPEPIVKNPRTCTTEERWKVLERDNNTCRYCGKKNVEFHIDHVYPYVHGGKTVIDNLVTACGPCNRKKHSTIGMWPKPIGYFEPKAKRVREIVVSFKSLFCTASAMSLLYVGVITLIDYPEFKSLGFGLLFLGFLFGLVAIGLQTQGK